jgi:nucleoside-diphosphate-sugar epimerase
LITGITGQDGAYLAEFLFKKNYIVHGVKRRSSSFNTGPVDHLYRDLHEKSVRFALHYGDMTDATNLIRIIQETQPSPVRRLRQGIRSRNPAQMLETSVLGDRSFCSLLQLGPGANWVTASSAQDRCVVGDLLGCSDRGAPANRTAELTAHNASRSACARRSGASPTTG